MTKTNQTSYDLLLKILNQKINDNFNDGGIYEQADIIAATIGVEFKTEYLRFLPLWCAMYILHTQGVKFDPTLKDVVEFKPEILKFMRDADTLAEKIYQFFKEETGDEVDVNLMKFIKNNTAEA